MSATRPLDPRCSSCNAPILWVAYAASGRGVPLDRDPVADGPIVLDQHGDAVILTKTERETMPPPRYQSHFASCPQAAQHRRRS